MQSKVKQKLQFEFNALKQDDSITSTERLLKVEALAARAFEEEIFDLKCEILIYLGKSHRIKGDAFLALKLENEGYGWIHNKEKAQETVRAK